VLVDNPEHHPKGDFGLDSTGKVTEKDAQLFTFSGIGLYRPELFSNIPAGSSKLGPLLRQAIANRRVSGQKFAGFWMDIGTPERLQELNLLHTTRKHHD
jgi:MurNAc alpha-1-phosphate uridylyltransferase